MKTRTELQAMSTRELIEHTRATATPYETTGDLLLELANRLEDGYVFDATTTIDQPQQGPLL